MVHITDTRTQIWLAIHQRTLQKQCLHMTNIGKSKAVYPHHSCMYRHLQEHRNWKWIPYSRALHNWC